MGVKTTQHNHIAWTDAEIDAVVLAYQQGCIMEPNWSEEARVTLTRDLVPERFERLKRQKESSMKSAFSDIGLHRFCNTGLRESPLWKETNFGGDEFRVLFDAWKLSADCVNGVFRFGETASVNQAIFSALDTHIRNVRRRARTRKLTRALPTLENVDVFKLRCMLGLGSTREIRQAGYEPGRRRGGVLPRAVATHFQPVETVGDRYAALEARIVSIEKRLGALEGNGHHHVHEIPRNHLSDQM